jgi:hypothetical protein
MKKLIYATLCLGLAALTSCSEDENGPQITITSPGDGDTFMINDTMTLSFQVTDDVDVASLNVTAAGLVTVTFDGLDGDADTNVPVTEFLPTGPNVGDFTVVVSATDNEGNASSESVDITIQ